MKYLNLDYRIVVTDCRYDKVFRERKQKRHLIGRRGLISIVGEELAIRLVMRAYNQNLPKLTCKLRRGITIEFYAK